MSKHHFSDIHIRKECFISTLSIWSEWWTECTYVVLFKGYFRLLMDYSGIFEHKQLWACLGVSAYTRELLMSPNPLLVTRVVSPELIYKLSLLLLLGVKNKCMLHYIILAIKCYNIITLETNMCIRYMQAC